MILIALGANLPSKYGCPEETLQAAKRALEELGVAVLAESSVWVSAPVPVSEQPWYRNAVIAVETSHSVPELLTVLKSIEQAFGRTLRERDAARVLDLDIIAYHEEVYEGEGLSVPHVRAHERSFVLYPLQEVAPDWVHPVLGKSIGDLIADLGDDAQIKKQIFKNEKAAP